MHVKFLGLQSNTCRHGVVCVCVCSLAGWGLGDGGRGGALPGPEVHPQSPGHVQEVPRQREDLRSMRTDLNKGH